MIARCLLPVLLMLAAPAAAAPANVAAAVAAKDRPDTERALDESRMPAEVLNFLGLERGDRVLDLIAGRGYYSEIMARAVGPRGSVLAHNTPGFAEREQIKTALSAVRGRAGNVRTFAMPLQAPALAPASFDFALLHLVYHDIPPQGAEDRGADRVDPDRVLGALFAAMKPGGIVGVIDHVGAAGSDPRTEGSTTHRIDPAVIRADFTRAGFVLDGESDLLRVPGDDVSKRVSESDVRGRTDRVVYRFRKPDGEAVKDELAMTCDVDKAQAFVGQTADEATVDKMQTETGARIARVVPPNGAVTMDFRPDRLTISTDEAGKIDRVSCG